MLVLDNELVKDNICVLGRLNDNLKVCRDFQLCFWPETSSHQETTSGQLELSQLSHIHNAVKIQ